MTDERKQLGKEQNDRIRTDLAVSLKKRLTKTQRERVRKRTKKAADAKMQPEEPCPLSKEKRDSVHIRNCRGTGQICHDSTFLFSWRNCHVFLNSRKNKEQSGKK